MIFCNKAQLSTAAQGPCMAIRASLLFSSEITYGPGLSANKQHSMCRVYFRETDSPYRPWLTAKVMYIRVRRLERELERDCDSRSAHTRQLLIPRSALCHARHTPRTLSRVHASSGLLIITETWAITQTGGGKIFFIPALGSFRVTPISMIHIRNTQSC